MTLRTWSGRALAMPTIDILASVTFIISVPVEISENRDCTRTPPARQTGAGHVQDGELPGLVVLGYLLHQVLWSGVRCDGPLLPRLASRYAATPAD